MSLMGGVVPQEGWMCVDFFGSQKRKKERKKFLSVSGWFQKVSLAWGQSLVQPFP